MRRVSIEPVTRIEGHARVDLFLDETGRVAEAYFVAPELRGFERLCVGRPVEELPELTSRICGLCPHAHHMASIKVLDELFGARPTPAARTVRELQYATFVLANHAVHFFALAGPDLLVEPDAPPAERSLFGVLRRLDPGLAGRIVAHRVRNHEILELLSGRRVQPAGAVPGGWLRPVTEEERDRIVEVARDNVAFAEETLELYREHLAAHPEMEELLTHPAYTQRTYSLGTVGPHGRLEFYDGVLRVVSPGGDEIERFGAAAYRRHLAERSLPWTNVKVPYLRSVGWAGLEEGPASGILAVGPLARLNVCDEVTTPRARRAWEELYSTLSRRREDGRFEPIHHRFATHWARLVEQLWAAERMAELAESELLTDPEVRRSLPERPVRAEAVAAIEAPRGTLIHDYTVDERGVVTRANLVVATTFNNALIGLTVADAARDAIAGGEELPPHALARIEAAIRVHDPCLACATHTLPGGMPLEVAVRAPDGSVLTVTRR